MRIGLFKNIHTHFHRLNLFDNGSTEATIIEYQRLATRIYIFMTFILLFLTALVTLTMERSITGYTSSPSESTFRHLSSAYSSTLQCPCREMSIFYQSFAEIQYHLHQVCSSAFITDEWIRSISIDVDHLEMSFFWQIMAGFCRLSQTSIEMTIDQFHMTGLISPVAIDEDLLRTKTQAAFDSILSNARSIFFRNLMAIQRVITANQFVSGLGTNFDARWFLFYSEPTPSLFARDFNGCSCLNINGCPRSSIEGIVSDCLMVNGVLQSSLHCYFNQTCLSQLHPSVTLSMKTLNPENNYQSNITSNVLELLQRFLLDQLAIEINFTRYYQQCQPNYCSYGYHRRFDIGYASTMIIGIFGAINIVLRFLSLLLAKKIVSRRVKPVEERESQQENPPIHVRITDVRLLLRQIISALNIFDSRLANEEELTRQRWTTRFFILVMAIAVIMSGVYIFFSIQPQLVTISHPSLEVYNELYYNFSSTLSCPCSHMSVPFKKFVMINYTLHQICSSTLVSSSWLEFVLIFDRSQAFDGQNFVVDFRLLAPSYFQLLATVCSLVQNTFDDALRMLEESHYINQHIPSQLQFEERMVALNASLTMSIHQEVLTTQNWLHLMTTQSQILLGLSFDAHLAMNDRDDVVDIVDRVIGTLREITETNFHMTGSCSCREKPTVCQVLAVLDSTDASQSYPARFFVGMNAGCIPWLGLLLTDTSWWYRTDIIDQIRLLFNDHLRNQSNPIIVPLSNHTQTRFRLKDGSHPLFEDLLKEALLEQWTDDLTRFDLFYEECAPRECTYLIQSQRPRLAALLLLISICGGLNQVLRWFSLVGIRLILYVKNQCRQRRNHGDWMIVGSMRQSLIELNLYRSRSANAFDIQRERRQTRLYLCLLSIAMLILLTYSSLEERTVVEIINPPSNSTDYEQLRQMYGDTLECPCNRIALDYNVLIPKLEVESFHPVCSSSFTNDTWFAFLTSSMYTGDVLDQDYVQWMIPIFQLLSRLCSLARDEVNNDLAAFLSSTIVINRLISIERFEEQLNKTLKQLQQQIAFKFMQTIESIRLSQHGNALISVFSSNWRYVVQNNNRTSGASLDRRPVTYEDDHCSCALSARCSMPATFIYENGETYYTFTGFRVGCTIFESLLQSSLECLYSTSCIDSLVYSLLLVRNDVYLSIWNGSGMFSPITDSLSLFSHNDTIEMITNRMFINRWQHELSYEGFFQLCAIRECIFTRHYRFDILDVMTPFLTFFGGISVVLRFLVPHLFSFVIRIFRRD